MNVRPLVVALGCLSAVATAQAALLAQSFDSCAIGAVAVNACNVSGVTSSGDSNANAMNIRPASDTINGAQGGQTFDRFFGAPTSPNRFLVVGDIEDEIRNEPNGQPNGAVSEVRFSLGTLAAGTHTLTFSFDYVFDTNSQNTTSPDDFRAYLVSDASAVVGSNVLFHGNTARNAADRRGTVLLSQTVTLSQSTALNLAFRLEEFDGDNSSAVGIDNLVVNVPEPSMLALSGLALCAAVVPARRRRRT